MPSILLILHGLKASKRQGFLPLEYAQRLPAPSKRLRTQCKAVEMRLQPNLSRPVHRLSPSNKVNSCLVRLELLRRTIAPITNRQLCLSFKLARHAEPLVLQRKVARNNSLLVPKMLPKDHCIIILWIIQMELPVNAQIAMQLPEFEHLPPVIQHRLRIRFLILDVDVLVIIMYPHPGLGLFRIRKTGVRTVVPLHRQSRMIPCKG